LRKGRRSAFVGFAIRFASLIRRERPDILHSYLVLPNLIAAAAHPFSKKTKIVWGVRASDMDWKAYDWLARLVFRLSKPLSHVADLIVVNSQAGYRYHVAQGYPASRMVVIANAIEVEVFRSMPEARRAVRAQWGASQHEKLVGIVGRLDPMKDHRTFLRAAAALRNEARFVIVGTGATGYTSYIKDLADRLGLAPRVVWAGARDDTAAVFNAFDVAVCSSSWGEGFPNVIGEAMASGVPCVATDVGDSRLVLGDSHYIVERGDYVTLAARIDELLELSSVERDNLTSDARQRIADQFSVKMLADATARALGTLWSGD